MYTKATWIKAPSIRVLCSLFWLSECLLAQTPPKDRVLRAVDVSEITPLAGNVGPLARPEFDQGRVEATMPMRVTMAFKMTAAQQADLNALLAAQQERGSPDYQRWLTPEQFGSRFGLSAGDIGKVTAWLEGEGFHVENVPPSRNMISFSGTAQQIQSALHTEIHRYIVDGKTHYANASDPSIPTALMDIVLGFRGLNNFQLKPRALNPKFTSSVSGNHFITPPDFATIYDVAPLYQQGLTGSGQRIVVVGQSNISINDVRAFRSNSGLPANDPQILIVPNEADPGMVSTDIDEASLDVEWAGAVAYNATVVFVVGNPNNAGGVVDAINYAITTSPIPAPIISTSYGDCEPDFSRTGVSSLQALMQQANAEGITVLAPSGDTGPADCDNNPSPNNSVTTSTMGLAVDLPGALESVTSIGGTKFTEGSDPSGTYWMPATGTDVISSARGYIPEVAWNDTNTVVGGKSVGLSAGGGGSSSFIAKPSWQAGTGVPNDGARDVPDISFSASQLHDAYLICSENFQNNTFSPTCVSPFGFRNTAAGNLAAVGGTSVGPPVMAGIVALINQSTNHSQGSGNINPVLYPLAARSPAAFHDVTGGNNAVPFSPACVASTQIGYDAAAGYDLATGLGSIDAFRLVTNWTSVTPASTANAATSVDFSIAFKTTQITVKRGSCGSGTLLLTRLNGFVGTPRFTCSVPATLGATTCVVVPVATGGFAGPRSYWEPGWWGDSMVLLVAITFVVISLGASERRSRQSRAWPSYVPGFALVAALAIMIGCGGNSNGTTNDPQSSYSFAVQVPSTAPAATGSLAVNAAIGGITHTTQVTLTTQ